ncbi:hypothetical protein ABPG72_010200 [Tetrahymena utriculariae]
MMPNKNLKIPSSTSQLEDDINQFNKEFSELKNEFIKFYKPQINSIFKQIDLKIQDQIQHNIYNPNQLSNQNITLFDKVNKRTMISTLQIQKRAQDSLVNNRNNVINFEQNLVELQNQLKNAQLRHQQANQTFENQKQYVEKLYQQKQDQDYAQLYQSIQMFDQQTRQITLNINSNKIQSEEESKKLESLKQEKEQTLKEIQEQKLIFEVQQKDQMLEQLNLKLNNNKKNISEKEQQIFKLKMQLNNLSTDLNIKQGDLNNKIKNLEPLENILKAYEQKKFLTQYENQLDMAKKECEDLQTKLLTIKTLQQKSKALIETLQKLIQKFDSLFQGTQQEMLALFSFVYQFSGDNDQLLLMFAQSFDSQTQFVDENQEKNLQKVFGLDQRSFEIFLEYIKVKVQIQQPNQIIILFEPNPKDEIKPEKLSKLINDFRFKLLKKPNRIF